MGVATISWRCWAYHGCVGQTGYTRVAVAAARISFRRHLAIRLNVGKGCPISPAHGCIRVSIAPFSGSGL